MSGTSSICRYEAKYLVTEAQAAAIARAVRGYCSPDPHCGPDGTYVVNTLYFETPALTFYSDTRCKRSPRFKVRVRTYGEAPEEHLWLELKHKTGQVTWKTRRRIRRAEWPGLLARPEVLPERPGITAARCGPALEPFEAAVLAYGARPFVHVRYLRRPFVSDLDGYARVTFDRRLSFHAAHGSFELWPDGERSGYDDAISTVSDWDASPVILELKSEMQIPFWMQNLIRQFDLSWRGFSKYCCAVEKLGREVPALDRKCAWT